MPPLAITFAAVSAPAAPAGATVTIRGSDIDGNPASESFNMPVLSPEEEAQHGRWTRMIDKVQRGAYHTRRRMAKALRRCSRRWVAPAMHTTTQAFGGLSEIVVWSPLTSGEATLSIGYASQE